MPVFMWSEQSEEEALSEFDYCGLCGHPTSLLVYVRLDQVLCGICGDCVSGIQKAYAEMLRRRTLKGTAGKASFE